MAEEFLGEPVSFWVEMKRRIEHIEGSIGWSEEMNTTTPDGKILLELLREVAVLTQEKQELQNKLDNLREIIGE